MGGKATVPRRLPGARRAEILDIASDLFHRAGFHGVCMDEIGHAAGVTGPALYSHFPSKTGLLAAMMDRLADELVDVDAVIVDAADPGDALRLLVAHQVEFALQQRALIAVWIRDARSLPLPDQCQLRHRQRTYVARWVEVLLAYNPELSPEQALSVVHGIFSFIASIAFYEPKLEPEELRKVLERKATACLLDLTNERRGDQDTCERR